MIGVGTTYFSVYIFVLAIIIAPDTYCPLEPCSKLRSFWTLLKTLQLKLVLCRR